jgi:signal transduction histidine kinase
MTAPKPKDAWFSYLRGIPFFQGLADEDIQRIREVCHERSFQEAETIFREGSAADKFYIVLEGTVEVWKDWGDPEGDILAAHGPGHLFGEMALIDDLPRSATVIARDAGRLLAVGKEDFLRIVSANSSIALSIMRSVSSMVRASNESFIENLRARNRELLKANQDLLRAREDLLRADRLAVLGKFSSLILHDIRNPISILRGFGEMILLHLEDADLVKRNATRIIGEADRLNRLASELLDYSRGQIALNMSIVDLRELVERVREIVSERFDLKKIRLETRVDWAGPAILDHERILRVLLNLADNSRKAMPKGGTFSIRVGRSEKTIVIEISDTGIGMDEEVQKHVFEPFFSSAQEGGVGLGMSIVKSVVEAHHGHLSFQSAVGEGTTFRIELPIVA